MLHKILGKNLYNLPSKNHLTNFNRYSIMEVAAPLDRRRAGNFHIKILPLYFYYKGKMKNHF